MGMAMGMTVLVVDDDPLVRITVCYYLQTSGWQTTEATTGNEALKILEEQDKRIGAVVADLRLPDMTGADLPLLSHVDCPFVFMSGSPQISGNLPGPVLRKPFDADALRMTLRGAIDAKAQQKRRSVQGDTSSRVALPQAL